MKSNNEEAKNGSVARKKSSESQGFNRNLAFAIMIAAVSSSFQHGYNTGVVNAPQKLIEEWIYDVMTNRTGSPVPQSQITVIWSIAVSIFCVGGMVGGCITGCFAEKFGRRGGLFLNNIFVLTSITFQGFAKLASSYEMIIFGRFLIGINAGLNAGIVPIYLGEISPVRLRGCVGSMYQLGITVSILIAQVLGLESVLGTDEHWPILLSIPAIPAIFQMAAFYFCPESPKHLLLMKGKEIKAQKALTWLRRTPDVQDEMDAMRAEYENMKLIPKSSFREFFTSRALRLPLLISILVMIMQQLSGINAVIFYSTKIFKTANLNEQQAQSATLVMATVNVAVTVVSLAIVEKAGRKTLLLIGFIGLFFINIALALSLAFVEEHVAVSYLCIGLVILYVIMFSVGPGSIPWFLVSELFNQANRPMATSIAVAINWTANFLVGLCFLPLQELINSYVFFIFAAVLGPSIIFVWKKVPETKNKTTEEITALFRQISYD